MDSDYSETPLEIEEAANIASLAILPEKSRKRYEMTYKTFKDWCNTKKVSGINEKVLLAYFVERSNNLGPPSLWCEYSMLKATTNLNENIDISKYLKLKAFLKRKNVGHRPKKSQVFTREDFLKFLTEAPNDVYLLKKVVAIMGIAGALRKDELCKILMDDLEDRGSLILVNIPDSKTHLQRSFTIVDNAKHNFYFLELVRNYINLRPKDENISRFFLRYQNGRVFKQPVGRNSFAKIPFEIATFLNLKNPKEYTGHAFRRTSATLLANSGIDVLGLKRHAGWKSSSVAEGYVADSLENKVNIANRITCNKYTKESEPHPSSSRSVSNDSEQFIDMEKQIEVGKSAIGSALNVTNMSNCIFNITINKASNN